MIILVILAVIGIVIKFFLGINTTEDGSRGPATTDIWAYGAIAVSVLGLMFNIFALLNRMDQTVTDNISFIKNLIMTSLPAVLLLSILIWIISLNAQYFTRINKGDVAKEYYTYNNLSLFMITIQYTMLYIYITNQLNIGSNKSDEKKTSLLIYNNKISMIMYMLTIGNLSVAGILTIILKYFSTDG
jgi:hypothetical protein